MYSGSITETKLAIVQPNRKQEKDNHTKTKPKLKSNLK